MKTVFPTALRLLTLSLLFSAFSHATEPTTLEEVKAHFNATSQSIESLHADFFMTTTLPASTPETPSMGDITTTGTFKMLGESMRMAVDMEMRVGVNSMSIQMDMALSSSGLLQMLMDINATPQAMKMDMNVVKEFAQELGVPESALQSTTMGMGMIPDPIKLLNTFDTLYTLKLIGKETLGDTEVFVVEAILKSDVLDTMKSIPKLAQGVRLLEETQTLYLGTQDGILRKLTIGGLMTLTFSNVQTNIPVSEAEMHLAIPEGIQVIDLTALVKATYENTQDSEAPSE